MERFFDRSLSPQLYVHALSQNDESFKIAARARAGELEFMPIKGAVEVFFYLARYYTFPNPEIHPRDLVPRPLNLDSIRPVLRRILEIYQLQEFTTDLDRRLSIFAEVTSHRYTFSDVAEVVARFVHERITLPISCR